MNLFLWFLYRFALLLGYFSGSCFLLVLCSLLLRRRLFVLLLLVVVWCCGLVGGRWCCRAWIFFTNFIYLIYNGYYLNNIFYGDYIRQNYHSM